MVWETSRFFLQQPNLAEDLPASGRQGDRQSRGQKALGMTDAGPLWYPCFLCFALFECLLCLGSCCDEFFFKARASYRIHLSVSFSSCRQLPAEVYELPEPRRYDLADKASQVYLFSNE